MNRRIHLAPVAQYSDLERVMRRALDGEKPLRGRGSSSDYASPDSIRAGWDGGMSFRMAAEALARGWEAGIVEALDGLNVQAPDMSTSGGYDLDVAGEFVSVPSFCSGAPDCMMRKEAGDAPRRVRLIINPWMVCSTSAATALAYAKATCAYASGLIQAGYDVAVTALYAAHTGGRQDVAAVPFIVKDFAQEPDASRLAFATHPAMMRRVLFAYAEYVPAVHEDLAGPGNYGGLLRTPLTEAEVKACLPDVADERMVILPELSRGPWTDYAEWLRLFQTIAFESQDAEDASGEDL